MLQAGFLVIWIGGSLVSADPLEGRHYNLKCYSVATTQTTQTRQYVKPTKKKVLVSIKVICDPPTLFAPTFFGGLVSAPSVGPERLLTSRRVSPETGYPSSAELTTRTSVFGFFSVQLRVA